MRLLARPHLQARPLLRSRLTPDGTLASVSGIFVGYMGGVSADGDPFHREWFDGDVLLHRELGSGA